MKRRHGPSLYYATDKNIFDALNQHRVDLPTIAKLFERRNIVVSLKSPREELAKYFSRLTHDYYDHQDISARLGIAPRRERTASLDLGGIPGDVDKDEKLKASILLIKSELQEEGAVLHVTRSDEAVTLQIQYSVIDYKKNEFNQVQVRDGIIEWIPSADGYTVRNTHNEYINNIRDDLIFKLESSIGSSLVRKEVSLFDVPSYNERSRFFLDLMSELPGFSRRDVTDVYVYKARPEYVDAEDEGLSGDEVDTHVERVLLRGNGVTRSEILNGLDKQGYYIVKVGWTTSKLFGQGEEYDIEAAFADPKDCTGFSFLLRGVYPIIDGKLSPRRRSAFTNEIEEVSRAVEKKALELATAIRKQYAESTNGDAL